ncbi:hypothetical protein ACJX0J_041555, partial [Zea mays]
VLEVIHLDHANVSKMELKERLAKMYKVKDRNTIFVFKFRAGSTGSGLIYDNLDSKKFEPKYCLIWLPASSDGIASRVCKHHLLTTAGPVYILRLYLPTDVYDLDYFRSSPSQWNVATITAKKFISISEALSHSCFIFLQCIKKTASISTKKGNHNLLLLPIWFANIYLSTYFTNSVANTNKKE